VASLIACFNGGADTGDSVVDDLGTTVALHAPARRVVSLSPAITELLFALGAGDRIVGRTQWDQYPPSVAGIPSVGDGLDPNVERVVALRPDLVAFYASSANAQAIRRLADIGIPSVSIRLDSLASVARAASLLGRLTDTDDRADSLIHIFEAQRDSARQSREQRAGTRVLILSWDNPPIVIGATSFLSQLVDLAGGANVFADVDAPHAIVTIETIAERNPDVILFFGDDTPAFVQRPEWQAVDAVRGRRFIVLDGSEFEYPSLRAFGAARRLRRALAGGER
jgi:iron complex transport system substrate-binding protein